MKEDLVYINSDKIEYIHINLPKPWEFKWVEAKEPTYKFFGLIKTNEGHGSGWTTFDNPSDYNIYTTKNLLEDNFMFVEENVSGKQWFKKPYVYIRMGKHYISEYFDTLEEAKEFTSELLNKSKSEFQVLIAKS